MKKQKRSSLSIIVSVTTLMFAGIFPGHNAVATPVAEEAPGNAAPRKNPSESPQTSECQGFVALFRSTSFSHDEQGADDGSEDLESKTGVPLTYPAKQKIGTAAVDPAVVPYGSLIIDQKGGMFLAVDTGTAVRSRKASRVLAKKLGITDARAHAPVIDFFMHNNAQVGDEWDEFFVIPYTGTKPFIKLAHSEKKRWLSLSVWKNELAKNLPRLKNEGFSLTALHDV